MLDDNKGLDINAILKILPHRYPFLLVDKIVELEPGKKAVGYKNVSINEPFFQGHFPGYPVMPGVLVLEAMAQVCLLYTSLGVCKPPVHVTADPALGLEPLDIDARLGLDILANLGVQPGTPLMGVSVRPWKDLHAYKAVIAKVCDQAVQQGLQVIFLPMHYPGDVEVSQEIAAKMQRPCIMVARELNFLEMLSLMKHVRIIMGMRLHFLIFGALLHIPMVGISYDPKVDRFLDLVQMPSGGLVEHLQYEDLLAQVSDVLEQEKALKQQLAQQMPGLREKALESAGLVAEVLKACKKNEA